MFAHFAKDLLLVLSLIVPFEIMCPGETTATSHTYIKHPMYLLFVFFQLFNRFKKFVAGLATVVFMHLFVCKHRFFALKTFPTLWTNMRNPVMNVSNMFCPLLFVRKYILAKTAYSLTIAWTPGLKW